jgi:hypothetical protein
LKIWKGLLVILSLVIFNSLGVVNAAENKDFSTTGEIRLATYENPITIEQIETIQNSICSEFQTKSAANKTTGEPYHSPPLPTDYEGNIVAYCFMLDKNGVPSQYTGIAVDNESVEIVSQRAQKWYQDKLDELSANEYSARGASFTWIGSNTGEQYSSPYGGISLSYDLYWLSEDSDSTYDWFAVHQFYSVEPGWQYYDNLWETNEALVTQDWDWGSVEYNLFSWAPSGTHTGEQTLGINISGGTTGASAGLSWNFFQQSSVESIDRSSPGADKAEWEIQYNSGARLSTQAGEPGSVCQTYQQSSGTYSLCNVKTYAEFEHLWGGIVSWTISFGLQITYN